MLGFQCQGVLSLGVCVLRCGGVGLRGFGARLHLWCLFTKQVHGVCWVVRGMALGEGEAAGAMCPSQAGQCSCAHLDVGHCPR